MMKFVMIFMMTFVMISVMTLAQGALVLDNVISMASSSKWSINKLIN